MFRIFCCLVLAASAEAATPLFQISFDQPQGWTAVRGTAAADSAVLHQNRKSLRIGAGTSGGDAYVRLAPVSLTIGKRYELSGMGTHGRPHGARFRPLPDRHRRRAHHGVDAVGRAVRLARRHRAMDAAHTALRRQPRAGSDRAYGRQRRHRSAGNAWFEGVSLDEVSSKDEWPVREAVQTFGPAYRYPSAGWIYLHIEGKPYDRGYQHGHLMAREIPEYLERCAADLGSKAPVAAVPHHRQRPLPARVRPRNSGGDARHRRWRFRCGREMARTAPST